MLAFFVATLTEILIPLCYKNISLLELLVTFPQVKILLIYRTLIIFVVRML